MRPIFVVVTLAACLPAGSRTEVPAAALMTRSPNVSGRVLVEGRPAQYFGVALLRDHKNAGHEAPTVFEHRDGRFSVNAHVEGQWDLVIAGPGFARVVIPNLTVATGPNALPDIHAERSHHVEGTVTDEDGVPVARATVRLTHETWSSNELSWELMRGNFVTETDADGYFSIRGVRVWSDKAGVEASAGNGLKQSLRYRVEDRDATIKLVVKRLGSIRGVVLGPGDLREKYVVVVEARGSRATSRTTGVATDGSFMIQDLPSGAYAVGVMTTEDASITMLDVVQVDGGKTGIVSLRP